MSYLLPNQFKKNISKLLIAEFMLVLLFLILIHLTRMQLQNYLTSVQQYAPEIQKLQLDIQESQTEILKYASTIEAIESSTNSALLFAYVLAPLIFLLIWSVTQGIIWKTISEGKFSSKNLVPYLFKFGIPSAFALVMLFAFLFSIISEATFFTFKDSIIKLLAPSLIITYLLYTYYAVLKEKSIIKTLKASFALSIKKIHKLFPPFLLVFVFSALTVFLVLLLFQTYAIKEFKFLGILQIVILILVAIILMIYSKLFFYKIVEKTCKADRPN